MRETLDLGGTTYAVRAPLVPIRLRLREAFLAAGEGVDMLAISGASVAAACPDLLPDLTAADQRKQIRTDLIDYGERAVDALVCSGVPVDAVLREGTAEIRWASTTSNEPTETPSSPSWATRSTSIGREVAEARRVAPRTRQGGRMPSPRSRSGDGSLGIF